MQRPTSQSDAASAWTRRAAYGAPEAPVMPRKTRKALFWPFGGLEENRELAQVCLTEVREGRHRRALVHTAWAFEVRDLEGGALVGVAVEAAGGSEQLGAGDRLRRQILRLHPVRNVRQELRPKRLLRSGALIGENAHRERNQHRSHDRDRTPQQPALAPHGERAAIGAVPPDRDGLDKLVRRLGDGEGVLAVIESMSGARFVHDELERAGWDVRIADALKARGIAPLACKTDTIDTWVLAELARLDFVPEIWLPDPAVRAERERARFRLHLVKHRSSLKTRIHAILFQHGVPSPGSDLFGAAGRRLLERLALPQPWASTLRASLALIDTLDAQIDACALELRELGADHRYIPLLLTCPGI